MRHKMERKSHDEQFDLLDNDQHGDLDDDANPGFFARNWGVITFGTLVALGFVALVLSVMFPPVALVALIAVVASSPVFAWAGVAAVGLVTALSAAVIGVTSALLAKLLVSVNFGAENLDTDEPFDDDVDDNDIDGLQHSSHHGINKRLNAGNLRKLLVSPPQSPTPSVDADEERDDVKRTRTPPPKLVVRKDVDIVSDEEKLKARSRSPSPKLFVETGVVRNDDAIEDHKSDTASVKSVGTR